MPYPLGLVTRGFTTVPLLTSGGAYLTGYVAIVPSTSLKWAADGSVIIKDVLRFPLVNGVATGLLPIIQAGFVDNTGAPVDRFVYTAFVQESAWGEQVPVYSFELEAGSTYTIDFDAPVDVEGTTVTVYVPVEGDPGPVGPEGPAGPQGNSGNTGPIGATGPQGGVGATGPQGLQGTQGIQGPAGGIGPTGNPGATGATGPAGPGVPVGGSTGQALTKISGTDYATQWSTISGGSGGGVPISATEPSDPAPLLWLQDLGSNAYALKIKTS